jgi:predicted HicB family RNase H-like nuclease
MADYVTYPLRMDADLYARAANLAENADLSFAQWARQAVREKLERDAPPIPAPRAPERA